MTTIVSADELRRHIGADPTTALDEDVNGVLDTARELISAHMGGDITALPASVHRSAILEVASELWAKRNAPGGVVQGFSDAPPVRLARNPMLAAYPLLTPYRGLGVG